MVNSMNDLHPINDHHKNTKRKNNKKFCNLYRILISSIVLLLCGLIAATLAISLQKPTTVILTAQTGITTTTQGSTQTTVTTTTTTTVILNSTVAVFWSLDNNANDLYNTYNGVGVNSPSYVTGYTGLNNTALNCVRSSTQYVIVNTPYFNFTGRSFTVEFWFYATSLISSTDYGIFGQCQTATTDLCFLCMIRNNNIRLAFYADDLPGITTLVANRWYHGAFVYDYSTSIQSIYLNGVLEGNRTSNHYQGQSGPITIGNARFPADSIFNGYLDQVSLVTRAKSASEILFDATVVCYYKFDFNSSNDSGSLGLNGSAIGLSFALGMGRVNDGISFTSTNSYFYSRGLTSLGTTNGSYSLAVWIKPTSVTNGIIIYVSKCNYNCTLNWCMPFIGFTSTGQIAIQSWSAAVSNGTIVTLTGPNLMTNLWTHVAYTYSLANGMRLYLNGLLYSTSSAFTYLADNSPAYIYLGGFPLATCGVTSSVLSTAQFYGFMDEFYLFSRELTAADVSNLANP